MRGLEPDVGAAPVGHAARPGRLTASIAKISAAMRPIFWAIGVVLADRLAPLHPLGCPSARDLAAPAWRRPTADAGSVSRPVFSVMSASLRPLPSPQSTFSSGTLTFVKRMMPFSMPLSPMKWSRWTTSTPGQSTSTMNAVIFFGPVRAITTISSATVPLVHQSFSPFSTQCVPSSDSTAVVRMRAGSLAHVRSR